MCRLNELQTASRLLLGLRLLWLLLFLLRALLVLRRRLDLVGLVGVRASASARSCAVARTPLDRTGITARATLVASSVATHPEGRGC